MGRRCLSSVREAEVLGHAVAGIGAVAHLAPGFAPVKDDDGLTLGDLGDTGGGSRSRLTQIQQLSSRGGELVRPIGVVGNLRGAIVREAEVGLLYTSPSPRE